MSLLWHCSSSRPALRLARPFWGVTWVRIDYLEEEILKLGIAQRGLPRSREALVAALADGEGALEDEWGHSIVYKHPAVHGDELFDLYSIGANGIDEFGNGDDISNFNDNLGAYSSLTLFDYAFLLSIVDLPIIAVVGAAYALFRRARRRLAA